MPTVIALDVSASLLRPADLSDDASTTRQDIAQRGVLHLLQWMEKWQEHEPVSLMTFSSTCRMLKPFGTSHADLRKALYDVGVEDTACVGRAVSTACAYLQEHSGVDAPGSQIILVVDGDLSFDDANELEAASASLPHSMVVHVIAMGSESELQRCDGYRELAQRSHGMFAGVRMPQQDATAHKRAFTSLARRFYQPYRGMLVVGHITCKMMLYPDPYLGQDWTLSSEGALGGAAGSQQAGGKPGLMPSLVAVRGFIGKALFEKDTQILHQTPVGSRHAVFPDLRLGSPMSEGNAINGGDTAGLTGDGGGPDSPSLCNILLQAMHVEKLVAVCHLKPSPNSGGRESEDMRACFLVPTFLLDGKLQMLLVVPRCGDETGVSPLHLLAETQMDYIPNLNILSYFPEKPPVIPESFPSPDALPGELSRLVKVLTALPAKKQQLYGDVERFRRASQLYMMPSIVTSVVSLLDDAKQMYVGSSRDHQLAAFYIKDMLAQLSNGAAMPLVRPKTPPPTGRGDKSLKRHDSSDSRTSISSLLS